MPSTVVTPYYILPQYLLQASGHFSSSRLWFTAHPVQYGGLSYTSAILLTARQRETTTGGFDQDLEICELQADTIDFYNIWVSQLILGLFLTFFMAIVVCFLAVAQW